MVGALHFDGLILLIASIGLVMLAQGYYRWRFRVPLFALAFCYFVLAVNLFGVFRAGVTLPWIYLRMAGDSSTLALILVYLAARRGQPTTRPAQPPPKGVPAL